MAVDQSLSAKQARALAVRAQGLTGPKLAGVEALASRVGAIQLDTISVLARSHELAAYARLGPISRAKVEDAYWGRTSNGEPKNFEFWSHAASILPIEHWPMYAFRRRANIAKEWSWFTEHKKATKAVVERLRNEGPLTASQLGGAKRGGEWWDWSDTKIAVEHALYRGEVVCTSRQSWRRVYDLATRAIPSRYLVIELTDDECITKLVQLAGDLLGVATLADIADYQRLSIVQVKRALPQTSLVEVNVEGWGERAFLSPTVADSLSGAAGRSRSRITPLSPFDSLVWFRKRTDRLFGFTHRLEAYVPKALRKQGYFTMPVVAGSELIGWLDPKRIGNTLTIVNCAFDRGADEKMAKAIMEAAKWVGAESIEIGQAQSQTALRTLRKLTAI
jgi:uncharacterized protein YcaQ